MKRKKFGVNEFGIVRERIKKFGNQMKYTTKISSLKSSLERKADKTRKFSP